MRVTNADSYSDGDGYSVGTFRNSDQYGYGYGTFSNSDRDCDGAFSDSDRYGNGNSNGDRDAHAAAYPNA